jgi:alpha-amylase
MAAVGLTSFAGHAYGQDVSPPVILQDFESTWQTITNRMPDIFAAGYGGVYTPPPGRAESGNQSVGYDVYDRFDLGSAGNPTLYGTATGLKTMVNAIHQMGGSSYIDLVWNQSGFADTSTSGFAAAGGYPGFALTLQTSNASSPGYNTQGYNAVDGDYHSAYATGDQEERLAGLVDIAQESNNVFIRQPTVAGPDNIPGPTPGAAPWFYTGLANVPNPANAQFYAPQNASGNPQTFYDPTLNQTFTRYNFNNAAPMTGTPTAENALGYLERYTQYMVQVIGADGFRVDAAKNMPQWVMNYLDLATYKSSDRYFLNGQQENIFSFQEVYDSSTSLLQSYINKSVFSSGSNVGGDRDVYDFPLFFAMQSNLTGTTANNSWYNIVDASIDLNDDGLMNGSQGVKFVSSQDNGAPSLDSVAYAYTLMLPGNAMVYYNGHNFGTEAQRNFPQEGREDALGGAYGSGLTTLVDLRNRYGTGNYRQDYIETNNLAYERSGSCLVMLSSNTQAGFDSRTIDVTFAPGTPLLEQTGNAHGSVADPNGDIPQLLIVNSDSSSPTGASVNARFLHDSTYNLSGNSVYTGLGYLIYGIPTPTGTLSLSHVSSTFGGVVPNTSDSNIAYENGTDVVSTIDVIKSGSFAVSLNTVEANLLGYYRYQPADGDNAIIKVDGGVDINGTGVFASTDPTAASTYGFEQFTTTNSPGYYANNGNGGSGTYSQNISATQLGQGYHYITVEAFTHRTDGGPAVFTDWKQTVYVDLAPPNSTVSSFSDAVAGTNENRNLQVQSVDGLANSVHTFLDLPFGLTDSQVLAMIGSSNQATQEDTNLWQTYYSGVTSGNHTATIVSYKPDGTYNIQRFGASADPFLTTSTAFGEGLGDLNFDGTINASDITLLTSVVESNNTQFNPAADVNGDGSVDLADTFLLGPILSAHNVNNATFTAYNNFILGSYVTTHTYNVIGTNVIYEDTAGTTNVTAGSLLNASYVRGSNLIIAAGAKLQIASNPTPSNSVSKVSSLTITGTASAWTGQIDLANNSLIVESIAPNRMASFAQLQNMVLDGDDGGKWDGQGIISSAAAADPGHLHTLAVVLNDNGSGTPLYTSFFGQTLDDNATIIDYTYFGDANLDGQVDGSDYTLIDNGFNDKLTGWHNGDFNDDGVIDGSDYTLIDNAFNMQGAPGVSPQAFGTNLVAQTTSQIADSSVGSSSVPEPGSAVGVVLAAGALLVRRRRKLQCQLSGR